MTHYVPHTDEDFSRMLGDLGLSRADDLFACVPAALRLAGGLDLPAGMPEPDVAAELARLAGANRTGPDLVCFAGGGAYDHDVPAVTRALAGRSEFVTSYTPYQPEVAQGVLQALFEYQTLVSRLAGLPVANASVYDGATATVEAVNLALAATGRNTVWVSAGPEPEVARRAGDADRGPGHRHRGRAPGGRRDRLGGRGRRLGRPRAGPRPVPVPGALVGASPELRRLHRPSPPGAGGGRRAPAPCSWACSTRSQPASCARRGRRGPTWPSPRASPWAPPWRSAVPTSGCWPWPAEHVRRLPGRLVGQTVDGHGRTAYVTTLRAREQDIRREKASSNICTNQTLVAVAAMVQMAWLGTHGLRGTGPALRPGHPLPAPGRARPPRRGAPGRGAPSCGSSPCACPSPADVVVERMADEGFLAGHRRSRRAAREGLLVAVTEKRTRAEMDAYVAALEKVVA